MCKFLSAIVTRDGRVLCEPTIDSHTTLMHLFKVHERNASADLQNFIRVEFVPSMDGDGKPDYFTFDKYILNVDSEDYPAPAWYDAETVEKVKAELVRTLGRMLIVDESRPILTGGAWLLGEGAKVEYAPGARLVAVHPKADLSGAYLSGADLSRANLSGADLSRADLRCAYLSGAYLSGADLRCANLSGADLSGANLSGAYLSGADLSGANLSGAYLSGANLSGADLSGANLSRAYRPTDAPAGWVANELGILSPAPPPITT